MEVKYLFVCVISWCSIFSQLQWIKLSGCGKSVATIVLEFSLTIVMVCFFFFFFLVNTFFFFCLSELLH